jgi:hypothetical protein
MARECSAASSGKRHNFPHSLFRRIDRSELHGFPLGHALCGKLFPVVEEILHLGRRSISDGFFFSPE